MKALDKYKSSSISALGNRRVNEKSHYVSLRFLRAAFVIYFHMSSRGCFLLRSVISVRDLLWGDTVRASYFRS